jgi:hypothetical protein
MLEQLPPFGNLTMPVSIRAQDELWADIYFGALLKKPKRLSQIGPNGAFHIIGCFRLDIHVSPLFLYFIIAKFHNYFYTINKKALHTTVKLA